MAFNFDDAYGGTYHNAGSHDDGEDIRAKIINTDVDTLKQADGRSHQRIILHLKNTETGEKLKPFPLNKTNAKIMVAATDSKEHSDWIGQTVLMTIVQTPMGDGVRLKVISGATLKTKANPKAMKPAIVDDDDDEEDEVVYDVDDENDEEEVDETPPAKKPVKKVKKG
jgi:hypothetical protein